MDYTNQMELAIHIHMVPCAVAPRQISCLEGTAKIVPLSNDSVPFEQEAAKMEKKTDAFLVQHLSHPSLGAFLLETFKNFSV